MPLMKLNRIVRNNFIALVSKIFLRVVVVFGVFFLVMILLAFTSIPYHAYHALGNPPNGLNCHADVIVVFGGRAMPSADALVRTYFASLAAKKYHNAEVIIAIPGNPDSLNAQPYLYAQELMLRGVDSNRISFEYKGYNTHSQVHNISGMYNDVKSSVNIYVVSSTEHIYRCVMAFKKAGFQHVGAQHVQETDINPNLLNQNCNDKSKSLHVRYNIWTYVIYQVKVLREYVAIGYYKIKGWV